ncbi:MAG: hypothetical protein R3B12_03575 [Candidatus Saccharimonadales bacterium]
MNKQERQSLYEEKRCEELLEHEYDVHYVVVTDGAWGAMAADRWHIVKAGMCRKRPRCR